MAARVVVLSLVAHAALFWAICVAYTWEVVPYVGWGPWPGRLEAADAGRRPMLGEDGGTGMSLATSDLVTLLQSREGSQQQPFLSEDDVGPFMGMNLQPAEGLAPPGERAMTRAGARLRDVDRAEASRQFAEGVLAERSAVPPMRVPRVNVPSGEERVVERGMEERPPIEPEPTEESAVARAERGAQSERAEAEEGDAGTSASMARRGSRDRPADMLPRSDRPMDGFTRVESVEMTPGGAIARQGRRIRIPRPQYNLATAADVWAGLRLPVEMRFEVTLDETGRVRFVRLVKGTGLMSIDRPVLNAVHAGTFAPSVDAEGRGIADIITLTITIR